MNKIKSILTLALTFVVLFAQVGNATAAPLAQTSTPITGSIQNITTETTNGVTTVVVTLLDAQNVTQTVHLSVDNAVTLGLVALDPTTNAPVVNQAQIGQPVNIDSTLVIPSTTVAVNPISSILATFFGGDASAVDEMHNEGFGFGVIAQALWMSKNLNGEIPFDVILQAKQDGSGSFTMSDGTVITYTNWGQLKKALLDKKNNLGVVVSGHENNQDNASQPSNGNEHGNGKGNGQGNGHGNGNGNGHNKP